MNEASRKTWVTSRQPVNSAAKAACSRYYNIAPARFPHPNIVFFYIGGAQLVRLVSSATTYLIQEIRWILWIVTDKHMESDSSLKYEFSDARQLTAVPKKHGRDSGGPIDVT